MQALNYLEYSWLPILLTAISECIGYCPTALQIEILRCVVVFRMRINV